MKRILVLSCAALTLTACMTPADEMVMTGPVAKVGTSSDVCLDMGPQTPRDISYRNGLNTMDFPMAPASSQLNLCNIHTHTQAEHKGPGFSVYAGPGADGGFMCNETADLTAAERAPYNGNGYEGAQPGDTIEVHWVHSSCDITPGEGLGSCLSDTCTDPLLRVETQVFLVVNDRDALDMTDMDYRPGSGNGAGFHQPKMIPGNTGTPVVFRGSTTGPSYDLNTCSPLNVTWSVRPQCAKIDVASLHEWGKDNVFNETKSHGVRDLVTDARLISPIR